MKISEFVKKAKSGEIDIVEHTSKVIKESKKINSDYNFFTNICEKRAIDKAKSIQKIKKKGALYGVSITIKDSIVVKGVESAASSKILKGYLPVFNSTAVQKGEDEGAIVIGKTVHDEFGFGVFSTNVGIGYEIPKNPVDKSRTCGGSSGGAAGIAKISDFPTLSYGESTGGSIVVPASFCGIFGLCPTYGRVSRYGLIDFGNSLDKIGPMSKYIEDVAIGLKVMSGYDEKDSTSAENKVEDYEAFLKKSVKGMKAGIIRESLGKGTTQEINDSIKDAIKSLEKKGIAAEEVSTPLAIEYGIPVYYILACSEVSTNLAKLCGMRYGLQEEPKGSFNEYFTKIRSENFGDEAKRRIILGTFARMAGLRDAYYLKAAKLRTIIISEYKELFKKYDVLISPTSPFQALKFDEIKKLTPLQGYMADLMTVGPNLAGLPHISAPVKSKNSLPVGMMVIADHFNEGKLITIAKEFDENEV